ncbi:hypothetical protein [Thermodesulfobacterium hveragerdense]|uniref:hypothetical protein n=1 Tax=Thermodesulfobacterium hveragerdense TaxID=53424 RepID=UPI00040F1BDD|nr:hypothetical protein [Thermodesulfobacterium hveragerdense]
MKKSVKIGLLLFSVFLFACTPKEFKLNYLGEQVKIVNPERAIKVIIVYPILIEHSRGRNIYKGEISEFIVPELQKRVPGYLVVNNAAQTAEKEITYEFIPKKPTIGQSFWRELLTFSKNTIIWECKIEGVLKGGVQEKLILGEGTVKSVNYISPEIYKSIIEECYLKAAEKLGNAMANEILK